MDLDENVVVKPKWDALFAGGQLSLLGPFALGHSYINHHWLDFNAKKFYIKMFDRVEIRTILMKKGVFCFRYFCYGFPFLSSLRFVSNQILS